MSRLVYKNITKSFITVRGETITALKDINLTVEDGEFVCLVGKSGCGKTTLLRMTWIGHADERISHPQRKRSQRSRF